MRYGDHSMEREIQILCEMFDIRPSDAKSAWEKLKPELTESTEFLVYKTDLPQLSIDELVDKLGEFDPNRTIEIDSKIPVHLSNVFGSYRGFYDHLAVQYGGGLGYLTVVEFSTGLCGCRGQIFEGYKGGEYKMKGETPVWLANRGESTGLAIVNVIERDERVKLIVQKRDD